MSLLFRRREVWVPTVWGALLMLFGFAATITLGARQLGSFLSLQESALERGGRAARTLVVEGWLEDRELDRAAELFAGGGYERLITTGGPIASGSDARRFSSYAERAAVYLRGRAPVDRVEALPAPPTARDRTYVSALVVREWARRQPGTIDAIDLYTESVHARRSALVFRMALEPGVTVGVIAATSADFDPRRWWTSSSGTKAVLGEALSLAWTRCCFWPKPAADAASGRAGQ